MATARRCFAQLSLSCSRPTLTLPPTIFQPARFLSATAPLGKKDKGKKKVPVQKYKKKGADLKKKKPRTVFKQPDLSGVETFALCDAMRYIRAFEVGNKPTSVKYDLALRFKTLKNGPVIRNRLRLPHPVRTDVRIAVICPPGSKIAEQALAAGASMVGEESIFEAVQEGRVEFDRCICQTDSLEKMNKAGMGRVLGPKGLMPSLKMGTVVKDPAGMLRDLMSGAEYRERLGTIRMAIGQLGFTPEQMQKNVKVFIEHVKKDVARINDKVSKELVEVILSSTNAPGFPLNGEFQKQGGDGISPQEMSQG